MKSIRIVPFLLVATLLLGTSPAYAATWSHSDARGDVTVGECSEQSEDAVCSERVDSDRLVPDVTRLVVVHGERRVTVRIRQRVLANTQNRIHAVRLRTDEGIEREVWAWATEESGGDEPEFVTVLKPGLAHATCDGLTVRYVYAEDMTVFSIPRRCLSGPRWVRAGGFAYTTRDEGLHYAEDDALRDGTTGDHPALSPRVRRG